jgi:hypothetical protein
VRANVRIPVMGGLDRARDLPIACDQMLEAKRCTELLLRAWLLNQQAEWEPGGVDEELR